MEATKELVEQVINDKIKLLFSNHFANGALVALASAWAFSWVFVYPPVILALAFKIGWDVAYHREVYPLELAMFAAGAAVPLLAIAL